MLRRGLCDGVVGLGVGVSKAREWWVDSVSDTTDSQFDAVVYTKDPLVHVTAHVVENVGAVRYAEEMLEMLLAFRDDICGCEPGGGITDLEPGHTCGVCTLIAKATGGEG